MSHTLYQSVKVGTIRNPPFIYAAMESSFILFLFIASLFSLSLPQSDDDFTGEFKMKSGGSDCKYNVMHFDDDGIIGFRVKCSCPSDRKRLTYSCAYFGKPNVCPGYNESSIARANFYSELARHVKGEMEKSEGGRGEEEGKETKECTPCLHLLLYCRLWWAWLQ